MLLYAVNLLVQLRMAENRCLDCHELPLMEQAFIARRIVVIATLSIREELSRQTN